MKECYSEFSKRGVVACRTDRDVAGFVNTIKIVDPEFAEQRC